MALEYQIASPMQWRSMARLAGAVAGIQHSGNFVSRLLFRAHDRAIRHGGAKMRMGQIDVLES
jgi:hypothetical protein